MFSLLPLYCNAPFCVCTLFTFNFVHKISVQSLFDHPFAVAGLPNLSMNIYCSKELHLSRFHNSLDCCVLSVLSYLKMNNRNNAPHTPRLILLGPTGCGKSVQAELLASKYGFVNGKRILNAQYDSVSCVAAEHNSLQVTRTQSTSSPEEDQQYVVETLQSTSAVTTL